VAVATPLALNVRLLALSVAPLVDTVAVAPLAAEKALVHGLLALAHAVTVTVVGRQLKLLLGNAIS
jgi:hypothetical protein